MYKHVQNIKKGNKYMAGLSYDDDDSQGEEERNYPILIGIIFILFVVLLILVVIIIPQPINEGVVCEKQFTAAYDEDITSRYTSETDKYEILRHHPDVYQITVYGNNWIGKKRISTYYVLEERYNNLEIGGLWKQDANLDSYFAPESWEDPIPLFLIS